MVASGACRSWLASIAKASRSALERSSRAFCSFSSRLICSIRSAASTSSVRSATWETKCSGLPRALRTSADREVRPDVVAVGVQVALAQPVAGDLAGHQLLELVEVGVEVVGMGELLEVELEQLLGGVAEDRGTAPR